LRKIVGFTSGYFDIMHPGHVIMLKECKRYCDYLIVAVNEYKTKTKQPDGRHKDEPIWTPQERFLMVDSNKYVDEPFLYDGEEELYNYLDSNKDRIDVRILGEDHKGKPFTGDDLPIDIIFNSRNHSYSTTNTIKKIIEERT
jgi:glycerol-3-phosphate cytidylyltransferase|tara:strand:- start:3917 stop:4342 length:426 start_codon:yes stop_codon:yes gene_type:complete